MQTETKNCQKCKNRFIVDQNDHIFYDRMKVPVPEFCPTCRQQQQMLFRNFKTLYKRPSSKSNKMIISMYNPDVPFPVWDIAEWWADDWEAGEYAVPLDLTKSFIEQLGELENKVPHFAITNVNSVNCEYSNFALRSKNCYLIFGCVEDENCDYGHIVWYSTDCVDNLYINKCELCYECIDCVNCNKLFYSQECESCADSIGLYDCRDCVNCIGCVGLRHKNNCIFNEQFTKEEYQKFLEKYPLNSEASILYFLGKREELRKKMPTRTVFGSHNNNVSGDHIYDAHNVQQSFDIKNGGENSSYCYTVNNPIESRDVSFTVDVEYGYQVLTGGNSNNVIGIQLVVESNYMYYSNTCYNSKNCFGCFGLRNKEYHILNKPYPKDEYEKLVPQIIKNMKESGDWGNFFPIWMSPFGYNESIANEYMPLTKEEAIEQGFRWRDDIPHTKGQENCNYEDLPKNPEMYNDDGLLDKILKCESCGNNYKFISREIAFYKRMKLPIPPKCFNCRHQARMDARNPRILNEVKCASCGNITQTTYPKEKHNQYKIYCEDCYKREIN
ncbi:MAG: zinc-ribbon domain containing protein [Candidatus Paceibacterota bacterium]